MLSACSNKPDERDTLAIQGLLSGALSSQGNYALIGSIQHGGSLWQTSPLERKYNWNHQANTLTSITEVALSGDATKAATASKNQYVLWNIQTGLGEQFWRTGSKILSLALNEQGSRALVGQESGQIWYMDTRTGRNLAEFAHSAEVRSVDLTRTHAVTAGDDFLVRLWELESKALVREKKTQKYGTLCTVFAKRAHDICLFFTRRSPRIRQRKLRYYRYHKRTVYECNSRNFLA